MKNITLDDFTTGYITCALWSSNGGKFGECPCCGKMGVLDHLPEAEFEQVEMCASEGCGVTPTGCPPPLDDNYGIEDIAPGTLANMVNDCAKFQADNAELLARCRYVKNDSTDMAHAGHDFWLTRCGHGAGFWDGDLPDEIGDPLTEASKVFGEVNLYPGDDGKIHD